MYDYTSYTNYQDLGYFCITVNTLADSECIQHLPDTTVDRGQYASAYRNRNKRVDLKGDEI